MDHQSKLALYSSHISWLKDYDVTNFTGNHDLGQFYENPCFINKTRNPFNIIVGRNSVYDHQTLMPNNVIIGRYCSINAYAGVGAVNHNMSSFTTGFTQLDANNELPTTIDLPEKPTIIGCDVWIGANAIIMDGIHIGHGACIGAGAVVTHDVEPYSIVVGVPARHLRYRFNKETIEGLLATKWWELPSHAVQDLPKDPMEVIKWLSK